MSRWGVGSLPPFRLSRLTIRASAAVLIAASLAACGGGPVPSPVATYDPEVVGVIAGVTEIQGGGAYVDLADGRIITLAASPLEAIYGRCCSVGYLILYGRRASGDWYATLRHSEGSCYALNEPAVDEGASIHFSFGLRLLKAPSFDPGVVDDGQFNAIRHQFCINDRGQVVAYE